MLRPNLLYFSVNEKHIDLWLRFFVVAVVWFPKLQLCFSLLIYKRLCKELKIG